MPDEQGNYPGKGKKGKKRQVVEKLLSSLDRMDVSDEDMDEANDVHTIMGMAARRKRGRRSSPETY